MRSYGPRFDTGPDGIGEQTMRVSQAASYELAIVHSVQRVGSGTITTQTLKAAGGPGRRLVQLVAEYVDGGVPTTQIVGCSCEREEIEETERLVRVILAGERRPQATPGAWRRQARGLATAG